MFPISRSAIKYLCAKYTIFVLHRGEKTRTPLIPGDQRPPPLEEGEIPPTQEEEQEEEEDVVEIGTTTGECLRPQAQVKEMDGGRFLRPVFFVLYLFLGDRDVREKERFTSESAQILIGEIMGCNLQLQNIQQQITDVIKKK